MKATLVIDMPKNCDECQFNYDMGIGCDALDDIFAYGGDRKDMQGEIRPSWCPLDSKKNRAISIEWIEKYIKRYYGTCDLVYPEEFLKELIMWWGEENGEL